MTEGERSLDGQVAVITGAASGIGEGTARRFVESGARVVLADINDDAGQEIVEDLGSDASYIHADVTREQDVAGAISHAVSRFGRLDSVFNNAGAGGVGGPIDAFPIDGWERTLSLLLTSVAAGIKHSAILMKAQGHGSIINTASVAGLQAGFGGHAYSAAKAAVIQLTKTTAIELAPWNVRVNCICPGGIATNIFQRDIDALADGLEVLQPIARAGRPRDIAEAALWLASDTSSFVTGHALVVGGGLTAGQPGRLLNALGRAAGGESGG
jgi:NAD(P)-dependent dehydrogenase (short-subunit alcohol dehydrogenase family)